MDLVPIRRGRRETRRIAIICAHGDLDEVYPALILASTARLTGVDAMVLFTSHGLDVITGSKVERAAEQSPTPLLELLREAGCDLYGCKQAMETQGLRQQDLVPQVTDVITAADFFGRASDARIIFT